MINNHSYLLLFSAYHIDKVKVRGFFAFKLTDEISKPRFGFFTSDFKIKPSVQFYNHLISNSGFPLEPSDDNICDQPKEKTPCTFCLFLTQKKSLIFFICCLFSTLILLLSMIMFHKRKRRRWYWSKNFPHNCVPVKARHKNILSQI